MPPMRDLGVVVREWVDNAVAFADHHYAAAFVLVVVFVTVVLTISNITTAAINRSRP